MTDARPAAPRRVTTPLVGAGARVRPGTARADTDRMGHGLRDVAQPARQNPFTAGHRLCAVASGEVMQLFVAAFPFPGRAEPNGA